MTINRDLAENIAINLAEEIERMQQVIVSACAQELWHKPTEENNAKASSGEHKLKIHTENYSELVTAVDLRLSKIILTAARQTLPQSYSEEELTTEPSTAKLLWQIDPLDGTDEFVQGQRHFCGVSAALLKQLDNGSYKSIAGIIYIPDRDLLLSADLTNSTLIIRENGVDKTEWPKDKTQQTTLLGYQRKIDSNPEVESYYQTVGQGLGVPAEIVQCGGAAHGFAALVLGEINLFCFNYDYSKEWDISAAQPIIESMGGFVCDLAGNEITYNSRGKDHFNRQGFMASICFSKEMVLPTNIDALLLKRL
ncbi:MAG: inositol monophosphatase family protein [Candidatus Obscuribacterales bacterium]